MTFTVQEPVCHTFLTSAPQTITVVVPDSCTPESLRFTTSTYEATPGMFFYLTANTSGLAPGSITWDLGDGRIASGEEVLVFYPQPGHYQVTMRARELGCGTYQTSAPSTIVVRPGKRRICEFNCDQEGSAS